VRWFGSDGRRYSKSFKTRKEADNYAKDVQARADKGRPDKPKKITLGVFKSEHERIMKGQVANKTLKDHIRALQLFINHVGSNVPLHRINARHAESFVAERLAQGRSA